jgi:ethanolamine utilization protein EutQ
METRKQNKRSGGSATRMINAAMMLLGVVLVVSAAEGKLLHPFSITGSDPNALATPDVKTEVEGGLISKNRVMGLSADKRFKSGLYSSQAEKATIEAYPEDEFMYFVKGGVTLTSTDGVVVRVKEGDAVHVPKGWKGTWETPGYTKFYVVYDPEKKE